MPFKPGHSGNPGGRPKKLAVIQDLAAEHCPKALSKIVDLINCADPRVALAAAQEILNRAYGKPAQAVEITKDVVHYVVKVPAIAPSPEEWTQQYQPKSLTQ